ncbi:MAG: HDIG domain-containing protein [Mucinivorans sp.]
MKKTLLFIMAAVVISLLIPQRIAAPFSIYMGQVWYADAVVAPFDIAIEKSAFQIENERKEVNSNFIPIFRLDSTQSVKKIAAFETLLSGNILLTDNQKAMAVDTLRAIYRTGVMANKDHNGLQDKFLRRLSGSLIEPVHSRDVYSVNGACQALSQAVDNVSPQIASNFITENLTYDERLSGQMRQEALRSIATVSGVVHKGEQIVARDEVITPEKFNVLSSMISQSQNRQQGQGNPYMVMLAQFFIISMLLGLNYLYFTHFATYYFGRGVRELSFVVALYELMAVLLSIVARLDGVSPYVVPLPVVAIFCLAFFNMRVAILANLSVAFIGAMFVRQPFDFFAVTLITGMVAILMMRHNYHRGSLMRAVGVILLANLVSYTCFALLREGGFANIPYINYLWITVSLFLLLGFYQAIYFLERLFGFVSNITLLELCDTNQPLLLDLAHNAPGTFQHSVQVANLAESAAKEIGANALLCRTGALYHDIGKMSNPYYFVENLTGVFNPHNDCTPAQSAEIVRTHVTDGVATARKYKLPPRVVEFITSHHGTSTIYFFWKAAQKENPAVKEEDFQYPGPLPISREVSICMMADAVEAASRSLASYDKEPLDRLVEDVINNQVASGQMMASELSFQDIAKVKLVFKTKLTNIYHGRIAYPVRN